MVSSRVPEAKMVHQNKKSKDYVLEIVSYENFYPVELTQIVSKMHNLITACVRARSHSTQIFDVVTMSSEMGCIVTNVTVHT